MENTLENKSKFFAQYYGQKIVRNTLFNFTDTIEVSSASFNIEALPHIFLELKSSSQISDEDAKHLGKYLDWFGMDDSGGYVEDVEGFKKHLFNQGFDWDYYGIKNGIYVGDFLRSKGYALPWMVLSVEKQIEYGWVKLKENN